MPANPAAVVPHAPVTVELLAALRLAMADVVAAPQPELLDLAAVMHLTAQSKSSVYRGIAAGEFPASVRTPSGPRWKRKSVLDWVARLKS